MSKAKATNHNEEMRHVYIKSNKFNMIELNKRNLALQTIMSLLKWMKLKHSKTMSRGKGA